MKACCAQRLLLLLEAEMRSASKVTSRTSGKRKR
jgi:hypothetical protein